MAEGLFFFFAKSLITHFSLRQQGHFLKVGRALGEMEMGKENTREKEEENSL